jgi:hypothetical protein
MSNAARQQITVRLPKSLVDFVDRKALDEGPPDPRGGAE